MSNYKGRPQVESALALDIVSFQRSGVLRPNHAHDGIVSWTLRDDTIRIAYNVRTFDNTGRLTLRYRVCEGYTEEWRDVTCVIRLSTTLPRFGGFQWWAHCPHSGIRCRKLHRFGGIDQFCHRTSIRPLPIYRSQTLSGIARLESRQWAIRRKLGDTLTGLSEEPLRPKWMRHKTFQRYAEKDARLGAIVDGAWGPYFARLVAALG